MSKKISVLTLVLIGLSMNNLNAKNHILERKVLSSKMFNCSDLHSINLFVDDDNNTFVLIAVYGEHPYGNYFLYMNNNWQVIDKHGRRLNGFIKDGNPHLAFGTEEEIVIYKIQKDKDIELVSSIDINSLVKRLRFWGVGRVIPVQGPDNSYCLLTRRSHFPVHPGEFLFDVISAGHGIYYSKPYLIEVQDGKLGKPRELRYGGKIDETFRIKEIIKGKDSIHFLGFRQQEERAWGPTKVEYTPVILHYAAYDLKKKKTTRKHSIYKDTPRMEKDVDFDYGSLSIDNLDDDIFVVFSWITRTNYSAGYNIKNTKSDVYYWQYSDNSSGDIEKVGNGFMPLVKVDSLGNVHVFWVDCDGNLVCKTKKDDKWSKDKFILTGIDILPRITHTKYVSVEFDSENDLHVVFPSNGSLVHAKVKLNVTADKGN